MKKLLLALLLVCAIGLTATGVAPGQKLLAPKTGIAPEQKSLEEEECCGDEC